MTTPCEDRVREFAALAGRVMADIGDHNVWLNPNYIRDVRGIAAGLFAAASAALEMPGSVSYGPPPAQTAGPAVQTDIGQDAQSVSAR